MHGESATLGHVVVHHAEDTLLHLTGVGSSEDGDLLLFKVDRNAGFRLYIVQGLISSELTGVHDGEIGATVSEVFLEGLKIVPHEHLLHEESVVGSSCDHTNLESVLGVPAGITIDNKDSLSDTEEVDSSLLVGLVGLG